jgi:hypothetical protein
LELIPGRLLLTDDARTSVTAFDPDTGPPRPTVVLRHGVPEGPGRVESIGLTGLADTDDALWVSDWAANAVYRVPLSKLKS